MQDPPTDASPAYMAKVLGIKSVKSSTHVPPAPKKSQPRKRKARCPTPVEDDEDEEENYFAAAEAREARAGIAPSKPKRTLEKKGEEPEEKRLRRFRQKAPATYMDRFMRVVSQRMFLIDRERGSSEDGTCEEEKFDIAGSTGNIYQVTICKVPKCTCPDAVKGNQCKHIIYVSLLIPCTKSPIDF